MIVTGAATVLINNRLAAMKGSIVAHKGLIVIQGASTVLYADETAGATFGDAAAGTEACMKAVPGRGGALRFCRRGLEDWQLASFQSIERGDQHGITFVARARHTGAIGVIAPTGRTVAIHATGLALVRDGRLARTWFEASALSLLQQIGAIELTDPSLDPPVPASHHEAPEAERAFGGLGLSQYVEALAYVRAREPLDRATALAQLGMSAALFARADEAWAAAIESESARGRSALVVAVAEELRRCRARFEAAARPAQVGPTPTEARSDGFVAEPLDGTAALTIDPAALEDPLPFRKATEGVVPPPLAADLEPLGAGDLDGTAALVLDLEALPPSLPFGAGARDRHGRTASPSSWALEHYASFCAERSTFAAHLAPVLARYALDEAGARTIDDRFRALMASDPAMRLRFDELVRLYNAYLRRAR